MQIVKQVCGKHAGLVSNIRSEKLKWSEESVVQIRSEFCTCQSSLGCLEPA